MISVGPVFVSDYVISLNFYLAVRAAGRIRSAGNEVQDDRALVQRVDRRDPEFDVPQIGRRGTERLEVPVFMHRYAKSDVTGAIALRPKRLVVVALVHKGDDLLFVRVCAGGRRR